MATKTTKAAPVRGRRSKPEVQEEFTEIREQVETARETHDAKVEESARLHDTGVREAVDGVTVEAVVQKLSGLGLEVSKALGGIAEQLTGEVRLLASLREAVELERKELDRLHKIDTAATALDQMVQDYEREKQRLEGEVEARRAGWQAETQTAERERKEQDEALRKQRQREIEDYEYKKQQERKKAQDKYDEEVRLQEKKNQEKQETLEKSWKQREIALKESEDELKRLRQEAEAFPARLEAEAEAAAAQATRSAEARLQQESLIAKKDAEAERRVAELRIKTLDDVVARQNAQAAALEKQLAEAKQQVQDIAVKAIEGASGARALSHINQIAMEQAKNRPQG
jgi:colicin import membrane protein